MCTAQSKSTTPGPNLPILVCKWEFYLTLSWEWKWAMCKNAGPEFSFLNPEICLPPQPVHCPIALNALSATEWWALPCWQRPSCVSH